MQINGKNEERGERRGWASVNFLPNLFLGASQPAPHVALDLEKNTTDCLQSTSSSSLCFSQHLLLFLFFLSADEDVTLAGFKEKFKTYVIVDSSGVNMWMSPASFKSSCDMVIRFYPFDRQTCHLTFGSLTFDNRLLKMTNKDDSHSTSGWNEKKLVLILMYR